MDLVLEGSLEDAVRLLTKLQFAIKKSPDRLFIEGKIKRRFGHFHILGEEMSNRRVHLDVHWDFFLHFCFLGVDYNKRPQTLYNMMKEQATKIGLNCRIIGGASWFSRQKISKVQGIRSGSVVIALYSFFCMFFQFFTHSLNALLLRPLYYNLTGSLNSTQTSSISWAAACSLGICEATFFGIVAGALIGALACFMIDYGTRKGELGMTTMRRHIVGFVLFSCYLLIFGLTAYVLDPHLLGFDMLLAVIVAGVLWLVSSSYILTFRKSRAFFDYELELEYLRRVHEITKVVITVGLSAMFAIFASTMYLLLEQTRALPEEIRSSPNYFVNLLVFVMLMLLIYVGFFVGVIAQRLWISDKTIERIKDIDTEKRILELLCKKDRLSYDQIKEELGTKDQDERVYLPKIISALIEDRKIVIERDRDVDQYVLKRAHNCLTGFSRGKKNRKV